MRRRLLLARGWAAAALLCGCAHAQVGEPSEPVTPELECRPGGLVRESGPIWDRADAEQKCLAVCDGLGAGWNGEWRTTVPRQAAVCGCSVCCGDVEAGPLFSQQEAEQRCPGTCERAGGVWNGQWLTTRPGEMSVCGCCGSLCERFVREEEAGPIWDQQDAEQKCPVVCARHDGGWDGEWRTTRPGEMSVCSCVECG